MLLIELLPLTEKQINSLTYRGKAYLSLALNMAPMHPKEIEYLSEDVHRVKLFFPLIYDVPPPSGLMAGKPHGIRPDFCPMCWPLHDENGVGLQAFNIEPL